MRTATILSAFLANLVSANLLVPRQSGSVNQQYINSVCSPNVTSSGGTIPPCISITTIESDCLPNGTQPLDYLASAECMCNPPSTFFADWVGCQQCLFVHGARSSDDLDTYSSIIGAVSASLCSGTPTAAFAAIFSAVAATLPPATSGATALSDLYPSQTAVSLYYTASGSQGPGAITGGATAATATQSTPAVTTLVGTKTGSGSPGGSTAAGGSGGGSSGSAATKSSGAVATGGAGLGGVVAAVGGLLVGVVAL